MALGHVLVDAVNLATTVAAPDILDLCMLGNSSLEGVVVVLGGFVAAAEEV